MRMPTREYGRQRRHDVGNPDILFGIALSRRQCSAIQAFFHVSGPDRPISPICVSACRGINFEFELNDIRHLVLLHVLPQRCLGQVNVFFGMDAHYD